MSGLVHSRRLLMSAIHPSNAATENQPQISTTNTPAITALRKPTPTGIFPRLLCSPTCDSGFLSPPRVCTVKLYVAAPSPVAAVSTTICQIVSQVSCIRAYRSQKRNRVTGTSAQTEAKDEATWSQHRGGRRFFRIGTYHRTRPTRNNG